MPIGTPKMIKCKKLTCKHKFMITVGDVFPQKITCPKCGYIWFITHP